MAEHDFLVGLEDDGYYTPTIKGHSLRKIQLHNYYLTLFSTSMKAAWPQRAYLGLYSGSGRARVEETGDIIETTAMSVFRVRHPFTKHIFVDNDPRCIETLEGRIASLPGEPDVTLLQGDVKSACQEIVKAMPSYRDRGLLSFCFIDPFSAELDFDVIRTLGTRYKMDFLILLMLGVDVRVNFRQYFEDPSDTRIASLIDDPNWREEWAAKGPRRRHLIHFLLGKFDAAMTRIGYQAARPDDAHPIKVVGKNVFLYSLVFYSQNPLGQKFWQATRLGTDPQMTLGI